MWLKNKNGYKNHLNSNKIIKFRYININGYFCSKNIGPVIELLSLLIIFNLLWQIQ